MSHPMINKLIVAHFCPIYLPLSETFIYRYLSTFRRVKPIVMANRLENLALFPLSTRIYDCSYKRYTLHWLLNWTNKRFNGNSDLYRKLILKLNRVRLLHAHFGPTGYDLIELKEKLGVPLVTTFYGKDMSKIPQEKVWQENYKELFAKGDLFLVEGKKMKNGLIALGCPEDKIRIQHIAIDLNQFEFRKRVPNGNNKVIIFFCGRFIEKKGLVYVLMAIKKVINNFSNIELRIIGDGPLRPSIEKYINSNRLEFHVKLLGMQPHYIVAKEMGLADIFIHPSITAEDGETEGGAPTIILEAQASGLPVLSTYHADIPNVVLNGKSALLSPEKDYQSLADNLLTLLRNRHLWLEMGREGRNYVSEYHDVKKEVIKLEDLYFSMEI